MNGVFPNFYPGYEPSTYQHMAVWSLFGLIFSIIVHELAHAVIAEYYDMPILSIRLFIFGGVAEFKGRPSHPRGEFFMAIAGPIMSFMAGLFFLATAYVIRENFGNGPTSDSFDYLGQVNFLLAAFNIVPAFPLDGGRALRAFLWHRKQNLVAATRTASNWGEIFAYTLIGYGCYRLTFFDDMLGAVWLALLGAFMLGAGTYAVRQTESWALLEGQNVSDFMSRNFISVSPDLTVQELVDKYVYKYYQHNFPVVDNNKLAGVIDLRSMTLDRSRWGWTHVGAQMTPVAQLSVFDADLPAPDALNQMKTHNLHTALVLHKKKLVGVLHLQSMLDYLSIMRKIDDGKIKEIHQS